MGVLGFVALGGIGLIGSICWRQMKNSRTCIKCARSGNLNVMPGEAKRSEEGRKVRCEHKISNASKDTCGYWFAERLRHLNRICFPTLGHSKTGKTVWLAMTYDKLTRARKYADSLRFDRERDRGTVLFDRIVNTLLHSRQWPDPTQTRRVAPAVAL